MTNWSRRGAGYGTTPYKFGRNLPKLVGEFELSMKWSPHHLKRYKDIAVLCMKYGEPGMVSRFEFDDSPEPAKEAAHRAAGDLPGDLERLGPTFVKLGQLLSSRPDLLPARYVQPLARLQDKV